MSAFDSALASMNADLLAEFGESFTYTPAGGSALAKTGIPINPSTLEGLNPAQFKVYWIVLSTFATVPAKGDKVTVSAVDYDVFQVRREDGAGGGAHLILSRQ